MRLFEYKELNKKEQYITSEDLNRLGQEGWELVMCDSGNYIFKREITDTLNNDPWGDIGTPRYRPNGE